jgi:tetratricopeptide (TPR) repeat protein
MSCNVNSAKSEEEQARLMIPDSYDLCPCASGKKYKFCCKVIFREVIEAMAASEDGDFTGALAWMDKAKEKLGETAEVLCRYAIIHHHKPENIWIGYLNRALEANPKHPRTHYIFGIHFKEKGELDKAALSYETAIANYPATDKFHLNETWNNLGTI